MSKSNHFSKKLLNWYDPKARSLPWKFIKDPYKIWVSEIILQQTRAEQATPFYRNFIQLFPTVGALAKAELDQVLKAWEGLGYYSRARNLHHAANYVQNNFAGKIPSTYKELLTLKGVGPYTAAAISSFAFGEAQPVLDGNVFRVLSRVFGIEAPINVGSSRKIFQKQLNKIFDKKRPALFNQSIMDFGATCCKPSEPSCPSCPMADFCFALKNKQIHQLPKKLKSPKKKIRYFNFLFLTSGKKLLIEQRTEKDIWQNLYQFPLLESKELVHEDFIKDNFRSNLNLNKSINFDLVYSTTRILTHQKLYVQIWAANLRKKDFTEKEGALWVNNSDLHKFAFPKLFDLFFNDNC